MLPIGWRIFDFSIYIGWIPSLLEPDPAEGFLRAVQHSPDCVFSPGLSWPTNGQAWLPWASWGKYYRLSGSSMTLCGSGSSKFGQCGSGSLTIKIKSPSFSKIIYSISLISKSKILLIFKSEPKS